MSPVVLLSTPLARWPEPVSQLGFPHLEDPQGDPDSWFPAAGDPAWLGFTSPLDCLEAALRGLGEQDPMALLELWQGRAESFLRLHRRDPDRFRLLNLARLSPQAIAELLASCPGSQDEPAAPSREMARPVVERHPSALARLVISQRSDLQQLYGELQAAADRFGREAQPQLPIPSSSDPSLGLALLQEWELLQHRLQRATSRVQLDPSGPPAAGDVQPAGDLSQLQQQAQARLQALRASQAQLQQQTRRAVEAAVELQQRQQERDQLQLQLSERDAQLEDARRFAQQWQESAQRQESGLAQLASQLEEQQGRHQRQQEEKESLLSQLGRAEEAAQRSAAELEGVRAELQQEQLRHQGLQGQLQGLEGERDALQAELAQARDSVDRSLAESADIRQQLEAQSEERRELFAAVQALQAERDGARESAQRTASELEGVRSELGELERERAELIAAVQALQDERIAERRAQAEAQARLEAQGQDLNGLERRCLESETSADLLQLQLVQLQQELEATALRLQQSAERERSLEASLHPAQAELAAALLERQSLQQQLEQQVEVARASTSGPSAESLQQDVELLELQLQQLQEELITTFTKLQECQQASGPREAGLELSMGERDDLMRDISELSEECRHLFQNSVLRDDLDRRRIPRILALVRRSMA